jgi:transcriptional regulator with XRE-family HTH domain
MTDMIKIGPVLSELMTKQGLTLASLAKLSGVPRTTLSEWSSNRPPKNPTQVKMVAEALGVSIHFLLFGSEDQQEPLQKILKDDFFSGTFEINIKRIRNN